MNFDSMPPELVELENRLLRREGGDAGAAELRDRVLRAISEPPLSSQPPSTGRWAGWYWAALAATVLLVLNLSQITASESEFSLLPQPNPNQTAAEYQALRQLESQQEGMLK
jgi:hypothetical protein